MKQLMENWRKFAEENDFVILCENYDQGSLTEEQFCNRWEQLILSEAGQVLSEDLLDVLFEFLRGNGFTHLFD